MKATMSYLLLSIPCIDGYFSIAKILEGGSGAVVLPVDGSGLTAVEGGRTNRAGELKKYHELGAEKKDVI
jgi:hypothetical protein